MKHYIQKLFLKLFSKTVTKKILIFLVFFKIVNDNNSNGGRMLGDIQI